jgi:DUF917 family protein
MCDKIYLYLLENNIPKDKIIIITQKNGPQFIKASDFDNKIVIISPKIIYGVDYFSKIPQSTYSITMGQTMDASAICQ